MPEQQPRTVTPVLFRELPETVRHQSPTTEGLLQVPATTDLPAIHRATTDLPGTTAEAAHITATGAVPTTAAGTVPTTATGAVPTAGRRPRATTGHPAIPEVGAAAEGPYPAAEDKHQPRTKINIQP